MLKDLKGKNKNTMMIVMKVTYRTKSELLEMKYNT